MSAPPSSQTCTTAELTPSQASFQFRTPDTVKNDTFDSLVNGLYSQAPESLKQQLLALYPYQGPGIPEWERVTTFYGDTVFSCNQAWLAKSFQKSYRYIFDLPPAYHGLDVNYTFYNGPDPSIANDTTAIIHQKFITNYVTRGEPGCEKGACLARYGVAANALSVNLTEIKDVRDPWANEKCDFLVDITKYS